MIFKNMCLKGADLAISFNVSWINSLIIIGYTMVSINLTYTEREEFFDLLLKIIQKTLICVIYIAYILMKTNKAITLGIIETISVFL